MPTGRPRGTARYSKSIMLSVTRHMHRDLTALRDYYMETTGDYDSYTRVITRYLESHPTMQRDVQTALNWLDEHGKRRQEL